MSMSQPAQATHVGPHYKWVVLSNTTIGVLLATLNATSLIIALPVIFRGIHLNPLAAVELPLPALDHDGLHAGVGRRRRDGRAHRRHVRPREDVQPRLRLVHASGRSCSRCVWSTGSTGALELVILRMFQAIGGALLMANSAAIITDAFPAEQLGLALGMNMVAGILGSFLGHPRRRPALPGRLALGVPRQRADRGLRDGLGLPEAEGDRHPHQGQDRLARELLVRRRPRHDPHRASPTASSPTATPSPAGRTRSCSR